MKIYIFFFIFMLPLLVGVNSCKPSETPAPSNNNWPKEWPIQQEVLDYFYFKSGSMWIYENDKTGKQDTVVITKSNKNWVEFKDEKYEKAESYYLSSFEGYTYIYSSFTQGTSGCIKAGSKWPCYNLMCSKFKPGNSLGESISWVFPFKKDYTGTADFSGQTSNFKIIETIDSIKIQNVTYLNVVKINITNAIVFYRKDINVLWAKGAGIICRENVTDGETWDLIYSNIIK
ncbi:MAG TPA: hypothetical protein VEC12_15290 [Bacteroidia bacterium]|nr:hypothetical protein [Bacteroidia bacterium]